MIIRKRAYTDRTNYYVAANLDDIGVQLSTIDGYPYFHRAPAWFMSVRFTLESTFLEILTMTGVARSEILVLLKEAAELDQICR